MQMFKESMLNQLRRNTLIAHLESLSPRPPQVPTLLPGWFSALNRGGVSIQRGASLIGRSLASGAGTGPSWSPPSPSLQEEPIAHSVLPDSQEPIILDKEPVGHADPILSSQAEEAPGGGIKTETLEDD